MNKQLNILAAEALGLEWSEHVEPHCICIMDNKLGGWRTFDLSDSNCRDLLIKHFRINVIELDANEWAAYLSGESEIETDPSRDKAIDKCLEKCLNVESDDGSFKK